MPGQISFTLIFCWFFIFAGSYIFIEASQKNPGDKARLLSGWIEPNETICVQFWYHMHGSDIGNLSIYLKTNQSETLVWRLSGDQGNRWRFAQTALNSPSLYKVRFTSCLLRHVKFQDYTLISFTLKN